jgi:hypothetical protein
MISRMLLCGECYENVYYPSLNTLNEEVINKDFSMLLLTADTMKH